MTIKKTYKLNNYQKEIIDALYKFRFVNSDLLTTYLSSSSRRIINSRLKILLDHDYIGRLYDSSYKLSGKSAIYYLRPKSITYLKTIDNINNKVLIASYKDKSAKESIINHYQDVLTVYLKLANLYPKFKIYSKSSIRDLMDNAPDMMLTKNKTTTYLLDYYQDDITYRNLIVKIRRFIDYADDLDQENLNPIILIICQSTSLQKKVTRLIKRELNNSYVYLTFLIITKDKLLSSQNGLKWLNVEEEELVDL